MAKKSNEQIKEESNYLQGSLVPELADDTDHFSGDNQQLLKFHGIYQQDNRDARKDRKKEGDGKLFFFMVRCKLPGGKLTAEQYLTLDELCEKYANGTLRCTTRQGVQFHGVFKSNLKNHMRSLNDALISTLAACGDVERNVMTCPAPIRDNPVRDQMQKLADDIAIHLCPRTTAYHEVWLNGEKTIVHKQGDDVEPIYGKYYLPRKFKTGLALPEDNCTDVLSNDCGLLVKHRDGVIEGFNVFVGGGMGMSHGMAKTYPRLATPLCFAAPDEVIDVLTSIIKVQRDHGNRQDRKQARMKYLIDSWGEQKFHDTVQEYYGKPLAAYTGDTVTGLDDHLGWHNQGDGKMWLGIYIVAGRIQDADGMQMRTGLREIIAKYKPIVRISAQQNILLCDIDPKDRAEIDALLPKYGIRPVEQISNLLRLAMACPALPTCGLALSDSERVLPSIVGSIDAELAQLGLSSEQISVHMTGCPNGCARPYNSDIGIVGRSPGKYTLFLGGNTLGKTMSFQYQDLVPEADIPAVLRGPLLYYKQARQSGEAFGDFCQRKGLDDLIAKTSSFEPVA